MKPIGCSGLTKSYGSILAVDDLNLEVEQGEVVGLLGPNGAGKTTTLRMLLGLITPTSGSVLVLDRPPGDHDSIGQIGSMVEEPAFYPWLSGRSNMKVLADSGAPVPAGRIDAALERAGALSFAERRLGTYSQGMKQRLGMAAALMRSPRLLLLDEPTNGLDPEGIREFRALVRDLAANGTTILLSSHLLGEVEQMCDRVTVLLDGRLVAQAHPAALSDHHTYRVVVAAEDVGAARLGLEAFRLENVPPDAFIVTASNGREVSRALAAVGVAPEALVPKRPSLEAWYLSITSPSETKEVTHADHAIASR
ncbi:MAG: ABC transporter ATP-binding protein [Actinomycetota bacterium]|nr:ABC transporter ATP-binding protein [Actinomycetota bacterium]